MRRLALPFLLGMTAWGHPHGRAAGSIVQSFSESAPQAASIASAEKRIRL